MAAEEAVPESRSYRHLACGQETEVSGQSFSVVSDPMSSMERTMCSSCEAMFPIAEFAWADTNETLTDYYARHSAKATSLQRFLTSKKCMISLWIVGFLGGAVGAYFLFADNELWLKILMIPMTGVIGVIVASAFYVFALCGPISRSVCGVKDTRLLK